MNLVKVGNHILNLDLMTDAELTTDGRIVACFGMIDEDEANLVCFEGPEAQALWAHLGRLATPIEIDSKPQSLATDPEKPGLTMKVRYNVDLFGPPSFDADPTWKYGTGSSHSLQEVKADAIRWAESKGFRITNLDEFTGKPEPQALATDPEKPGLTLEVNLTEGGAWFGELSRESSPLWCGLLKTTRQDARDEAVAWCESNGYRITNLDEFR